MSTADPRRDAPFRDHAAIFAALGDETRLALVGRLSGGSPLSISRLADGSSLTRQAVTKHLRVLQEAGVVHSVRAGRENLFELRPAPLQEARSYLGQVADQWEQALMRLKSFVEE